MANFWHMQSFRRLRIAWHFLAHCFVWFKTQLLCQHKSKSKLMNQRFRYTYTRKIQLLYWVKHFHSPYQTFRIMSKNKSQGIPTNNYVVVWNYPLNTIQIRNFQCLICLLVSTNSLSNDRTKTESKQLRIAWSNFRNCS